MRYALSLDDVLAAAERIRGRVWHTPVFTSRSLDAMAGCALFFKAENLQRCGAFKARGATNAVFSLTDEEAARGVATHSSGNHAAALALAARTRGILAFVVMPTDAPPVKKAAVLDFGARVVDCAPGQAAREAACAAVVAETGATFVHPSEDPRVIAGQGTILLELLDQVPDLDAVIAPVGGGGLVSGLAIAAALRPGLRVFGAEPSGADDAIRSRRAGERLPQLAPKTLADGLRTSLGDNTWPVVRDLVEDILPVEEDDLVAAMRACCGRLKLVVEPSGAVPVAAALSGALAARGLRRVAVVISGGNVDLDRLPWG